MYYPRLNGSVELVENCGYNYECQLPEVGYGKHRITGELVFVGIRKVSEKKSEQVWKPLTLPADWSVRRKKEIAKDKAAKAAKPDDPNVEYFDPALQVIRDKWWLHRLCGEWILINGKPTYIPPSFWIYLTCCPLDVGLPTYRDTDRRLYYVWEYCCEDPRCGGLVDVERRRMGKTFKSGSIILDRTSIYKHHHAGLQSKTSGDAKGVFLKTVVNFFKKFPDFFRPIYDTSKGITPTSELRFFQTTVKGKRAESVLEGEELESWVDWGSSDIFHYDGTKLGTYVMDEFGKTVECDVWERWNVVRFCLDQDGEWVGKALLTSTIEEMESGGKAAKKIWEASNPAKRDANGRTASGLYRFFLPAFETTFFDKFGMPESEKGRQFYLNQREGLSHDAKALSSIIRKNPFSIEEAFRVDASTCLFNAIKLNDQRDFLSWNKDLVERGNFEWENGVQDSRVVWIKNPHGRWEIARGFNPGKEEVNNTTKRGSNFFPANSWRFRSAVDPYDIDVTKDGRGSNAAALVKQVANLSNHTDPLIGAYVCKYLYRPKTADLMFEDMIKQCFYFSCELLPENNKGGIIKYFQQRGYAAFLMWLPGEKIPGVNANKQTKQAASYFMEAMVQDHCDKLFFIDLIEDLLDFDIDDSTANDLSMAFMWTEYACTKLVKRRDESNVKQVTQYFRTHKVNA